MGIQEPCYICGADVFSTLQEAPSKNWNGICMRLYKVRKHIAELIFLLESSDAPLLVREEGRQGMAVIFVDFGHVRIGNDDEGQVSQSLNSGGKSRREQGESEIRRSQKRIFR